VITLGNSIYSGSNTDPPLDVLARSTIECNTSYRVISGKRFTIEGKLLEEETWIPLSVHDLDVILEGGPYLGGNHPSIPSNQVQISRLFSDNEGIFRYNHVFEPGNHKVILDWDGTFYYNGTSRTLNVTAIPLTIDPDPIDYLVRGEANQITGKVHAEELTPESGEGVEIYLGQEYLGAALTDDYGFFSLSYNIPDSTAVSEVQLVYYLVDGYSITQSTVVAIRPTLNYLPRGVGTWKKPFQIEAVIQNDNGRPMGNVNMKLMSGNKSQTLSTDDNGRVMFNVSLDSRPDNDLYEFQIEYSGTKYIMPIIISGTVKLNAIINYLGLFLGLLKLATVLGVCYGAYVLVSRQFPGINGVSLSIDTGQVKEEEEDFATGVYIIRSDKARIDIKIHEIEDNLPLVWGVHEPFTFKIEIKSEQLKALYSIDVVGLEDTKKLRIEDGASSEIAIYQNKGLKHISFIYEDLEEEVYAETLLIMHIVDYREEIVRQFNKDFREQLKRRDALNERLTAREMLNRISAEPDSIGIEALNRMVYNFEEATYSNHPITIDNYRDYMQSRNTLEVSEDAG
jgi:hypothetical protein